MVKRNKMCFVIMGFGKKSDPTTGRTLDLDKTYQNIIQPAVKSLSYDCIRADEIQDSSLIDKSMYALLMHADLVVADITTFNPNAIYELGVRHAVKPQSTIILKEEGGTIPFDLDHTRILTYKHLGEDIGTNESARCQKALAEKIKFATKNKVVDSPLYDYLSTITPPKLPQSEYEQVINEMADRERHIFAIVERAKACMVKDEFSDAAKYWEKASLTAPSEEYFTQQHALATYKSKKPSEETSLMDALGIIRKLLTEDGDSNDPETLGICGAIYKRLWTISGDIEQLHRAIDFYEKGFQIRNDFYTGENYALCLDMKASHESDQDEKVYYQIRAKKIRQKILDNLKEVAEILQDKPDLQYKWASATLSICNFALGNDREAHKFENLFLNKLAEANWEKDTFKKAKEQISTLLGK